MGDDWQPGDLALCVKSGPGDSLGQRTIAGRVYEVSDAFWSDLYCEARLRFVGFRYEQNVPWHGSSATRFRKVTPDAADEFDRETIALLTGKPAQVPA